LKKIVDATLGGPRVVPGTNSDPATGQGSTASGQGTHTGPNSGPLGITPIDSGT